MSLFSLPVIAAPIAPTAASAYSSLASIQSSSADPGRATAPSFATMFNSALSEVSRLQNDVSTAQARFQVGAPGASIEETMVSMQKAQLAFTSALTVRNRLVAAYSDIMNMPV